MPIFQEPHDQDDARVPQSARAGSEAEFEPEFPNPEHLPFHGRADLLTRRNHDSLSRKISEESIRTDLCDGLIPDNFLNTTPPRPPDEAASTTTSDRIELVERLKRGESPSWSPRRQVRPRHRFQYIMGLGSILTGIPARISLPSTQLPRVF